LRSVIPLPLRSGERVVVGGFGGRQTLGRRRIVAKRNSPAIGICARRSDLHRARASELGRTALIGPAGELLGIGSLQLQHAAEKGQTQNIT